MMAWERTNPRLKTPPDNVRFTLGELMQEAHLMLTPFEDSTWEVVDKKNNRVWTSDLDFVIFNKEDGE